MHQQGEDELFSQGQRDLALRRQGEDGTHVLETLGLHPVLAAACRAGILAVRSDGVLVHCKQRLGLAVAALRVAALGSLSLGQRTLQTRPLRSRARSVLCVFLFAQLRSSVRLPAPPAFAARRPLLAHARVGHVRNDKSKLPRISGASRGAGSAGAARPAAGSVVSR